MRLRFKLLLVNGLVAVIAGSVLWLAYAGTRTVGREYVRLSEGNLQVFDALQDMRAAASGIVAATGELAMLRLLDDGTAARDVVREADAAEAGELREAVEAFEESVAAHLGVAERFFEHEVAHAAELEARGLTLVRASEYLLRRLADGGTGRELSVARAGLEAAEQALLGSIAGFLEHEAEELAERSAQVTGLIASSGRTVAVAGLGTLLLMAAACYVLALTIAGPIGRLTEAMARVATGEAVPVEAPSSRDEIGRLVVAFRTMTEDLARSQADARHLALHDGMTGLPNRALLAERLAGDLARARRDEGAVAVLCLDLDRFKEVNDTLGHAAGDLLLRQVAERLRAAVREADTVARLGGDEFAILQSGAQQPADAEALCRRLAESLGTPFLLDEQEILVGVSIGVALGPEDGDDPGTLLKHADIALYRAKGEGRGTFRFFEDAMNVQIQARKTLERDLRRALAEGQFRVHYQPLVDLRTGGLVGAEALLRWQHPERGEVMPGAFIPAAEESGLIVPIGEWVLRAACAQAAAWAPLRIAVNLSPVQFRQRDLDATVARILAETGLEPGRLELEITEGVLLEDTEAALETLRGLKRLGVRLAMDDFGTGYSSLSYLRRFPFDKIKIDRSFVADLGHSADAVAIVRSVVGLGASLGMTTNAEGVEVGGQADLLRAEGCDEVQGFHFGRPVPAAEFATLVGRGPLPGDPPPPGGGGEGRVPVPA